MIVLQKVVSTPMSVILMLLVFANLAFASDKVAQRKAQNNQSNPVPIDNDTINDADIDKALHALIFGVDCSGGEIAEQKALPKGVINASNNATIDSTKYQRKIQSHRL